MDDGSWTMMHDKLQMEDERRQMTDESRQMDNGSGQCGMANEKWQMRDGR